MVVPRARVRMQSAAWLLAGVVLASAGSARAAAPGALDPSFGGGGVVSAGGSGVQLFGVAAAGDGSVVVAGAEGGSVLVQRLSSSGSVTASYHGPAGYARSVAIAANGTIAVGGSSGGAMLVERLTSALTPDGSFGSGGVATAFGGQGAVANGVAVTPGDGIVAAGAASGQTAVAQFGSGGALAWTQGGFGGSAALNAVAVQPDGQAVVAGVQYAGQLTNGLVARLTSTGALDKSFAGSGATLFYVSGSGYTSLTGVAVQNDGKIVVGGFGETPVAVAGRYNTNGSLDTTFGSGGRATVPSGQDVEVPDYPIGAYGLGIAGGGRIVTVGNYEASGTEVDQALSAFTAAGQPEAGLVGGNGTESGGTGVVRGPTGAVEGCGMAVDPTTGNVIAVGDAVTALPDANPCSTAAGGGFVTRFIGFGPPPPPATVPTTSAPGVVTGSAGGVTISAAALTGEVNPGGLATQYEFQYGTSTNYGSATAVQALGAGTSLEAVSAALSGLRAGTTYHYRLLATNADGTTFGADRTFITSPAAVPPPVRLSGSLSHPPSSVALATLRRHGLLLRVGCTEACAIGAQLTISSSTVSRLRLGHGTLLLASGTAHLTRSGSTRVSLVASRHLPAGLSKLRSLRITLTIVVRKGSRRVTFSRSVTLTG